MTQHGADADGQCSDNTQCKQVIRAQTERYTWVRELQKRGGSSGKQEGELNKYIKPQKTTKNKVKYTGIKKSYMLLKLPVT